MITLSNMDTFTKNYLIWIKYHKILNIAVVLSKTPTLLAGENFPFVRMLFGIN